MALYNNILETIGKTPLVKINKLNEGKNIYAKVEFFNPGGSIKDRAAFEMIDNLEKRGEISPDKTVLIEPTSGNTGIGLALIAAVKGYRLILTMPENMSPERRKLLSGYGAELILTPKEDGMKGSIDMANKLNKDIKNSIIMGQFSNPLNPLAHEKTTAVEIMNDINPVDIICAGIGTGGTVTGIARKIKETNKNLYTVGVEPLSSPLITKGFFGPHKIQGIGANFIPDNYDKDVVDEVIAISDEEAIDTARELMKKEGIMAGISSGANMAAAIKLSKRKENENKNIIVILPDTGERYLSSELFD